MLAGVSEPSRLGAQLPERLEALDEALGQDQLPARLQERRHHLERTLLLGEALQIDQDAHADDRVVRALEPRGLEDVVVDEGVVALADALSCALDHVLGVIHRVDVLDQLTEPLGREAVAAADLEDAHVAGEIRPDVVVLQVALEDVHDVDFDVVGHRSRAVIPMLICRGLHAGTSVSRFASIVVSMPRSMNGQIASA